MNEEYLGIPEQNFINTLASYDSMDVLFCSSFFKPIENASIQIIKELVGDGIPFRLITHKKKYYHHYYSPESYENKTNCTTKSFTVSENFEYRHNHFKKSEQIGYYHAYLTTAQSNAITKRYPLNLKDIKSIFKNNSEVREWVVYEDDLDTKKYITLKDFNNLLKMGMPFGICNEKHFKYQDIMISTSDLFFIRYNEDGERYFTWHSSVPTLNLSEYEKEQLKIMKVLDIT